jgi:hypothetical protein
MWSGLSLTMTSIYYFPALNLILSLSLCLSLKLQEMNEKFNNAADEPASGKKISNPLKALVFVLPECQEHGFAQPSES